MRYPLPALWRVRPLNVHDGDTIKVYVDCGGPNEKRETWDIRFKAVFAPELSQPGGVECRDFVQAWIDNNGDGTEWPFLLETFRTPRSDADVMTFSRYVGIVTSASGRSLNADVQAFVIASGYGGGIGA